MSELSLTVIQPYTFARERSRFFLQKVMHALRACDVGNRVSRARHTCSNAKNAGQAPRRATFRAVAASLI